MWHSTRAVTIQADSLRRTLAKFGWIAGWLLTFLPSFASGKPVDTFTRALPLFENYLPDVIGTNAPVTALAEAPNGVLYAGADRLLIFDGGDWSQAETPTGVQIHSLAVDGDRVWAGGLAEVGVFEKTASGKFTFTSHASRVPGGLTGIVWHVFAEPQSIVVVTTRMVCSLPRDGGDAKVWELPNERQLVAQRIGEGVLIQQPLSTGNKLWLTGPAGLVPYEKPVGELKNRNADFISDNGVRWWYNARTDLMEFNQKTGEQRIIYQDRDQMLARAWPSGGCEVNGCIYIPTLYDGLYIFDRNGRFVHVGREHGLPSDQCCWIVPSREGGVWLATEQGVTFVHDFNAARLIPDPAGARVVLPTDTALWMSSPKRTVAVSSEAVWEYPIPAYSLLRSGSNVVIGTFGSMHVKKDAAEEFTRVGSFPAAAVVSMTADPKDPDVVVAAAGRAVYRVNVALPEQKVIETPGFATSVTFDGEGLLWMGTGSAGVHRVDRDFTNTKPVIAGKEQSLLALHKGRVLALFSKRGAVTEDDKLVPDSALSGLQAAQADQGPAWVFGTQKRSVRVGRMVDGPEGLRFERKNVPMLRKIRTVRDAALKDETLYLATELGVFQLDTGSLRDAELDKPKLVDVSAFDGRTRRMRTVDTTGTETIRLSVEENEISVSPTKHVWGLWERPNFQSRLLPGEIEWTEHAYGEAITRKNLSAGQYRLEVRSVHLGVPSETAVLKFAVAPAWYRSWWGILLFAAAVGGLFFAAVRFRTRNIARKNRELEERIDDRTQELARANAAKSDFLAAMSHEIRNPLNGVVGIVKMLEESNLGVREKYLLKTLQRCAEQLRGTVDDVLDFSKIEAGAVTLNRDTFNIEETVKSTIASVDVGGERVHLNSWNGPRPLVRGDHGKLVQIFSNYLSNALKYGMPPEAKVDVDVRDTGEKSCQVTLRVTNAGPDIPAPELARLFTRFQRGDDAKVRRINGSGLGLSICKKNAEALGGTVGASSSGGTTVFYFSLPLEKADIAGEAAQSLLRKRQNARALAVEDEDYNRLVLGNVLAKLGYKVDWAVDGRTAIQLAEQNAYDVVLMDCMLPDMDGSTLTKKLLMHCTDPKPPIIAVTAYSTKQKLDECMAAGMSAFISKPVTIEKLESALRGTAPETVATRAAPVEELPTSVSLQQLARIGPVETVVPEFTDKLERDWKAIEDMTDRDPLGASKAVHKLVSATLLVRAQYLSDQLRLLETNLSEGGSKEHVVGLREICAEELAKVATALRVMARRQQQPSSKELSEAQR